MEHGTVSWRHVNAIIVVFDLLFSGMLTQYWPDASTRPKLIGPGKCVQGIEFHYVHCNIDEFAVRKIVLLDLAVT